MGSASRPSTAHLFSNHNVSPSREYHSISRGREIILKHTPTDLNSTFTGLKKRFHHAKMALNQTFHTATLDNSIINSALGIATPIKTKNEVKVASKIQEKEIKAVKIEMLDKYRKTGPRPLSALLVRGGDEIQALKQLRGNGRSGLLEIRQIITGREQE